MLQLTKKVEYGLMALRHMALNGIGNVYTAKEIASKYDIPYELLAKVLQKLAKSGIILSIQGTRGGYSLIKNPEEIQVSQIINIIENEKPTIVDCCSEGGEDCSKYLDCTIREPLIKVQKNINAVLEKTTLAQII